jgi:hypothetical protein
MKSLTVPVTRKREVMNVFAMGDGSNQRMLGQIGGQYEPSQDHAVRHILFAAVEDFILISIIIWIVKRMFRRPIAALVFIGGVMATAAISVHEQHFYPLVWIPLVIGLIGFGRVVRP